MTKEEAVKLIEKLEKQNGELSKKITALHERLELLETQIENKPGDPVVANDDDDDDDEW